MILVKNLKFLHISFLGKIGREKVFGDALDKNVLLSRLQKHRRKKVAKFA